MPLNQRFYATSNEGVVTVTAGVTLACAVSPGATISYGPVAGYPLSWTASIAGTPSPAAIVTTTIDGVDIDYTVQASDTSAPTLAASIADAINATTTPDPYSGIPVNRLLYANANGATIYFITMGAGAPFTLSCNYMPAHSGTYTAPTPTAAYYAAGISATIAAGETFTTTITTITGSQGVTFVYTAKPTDTPATVAEQIAAQINNSVLLDPATNMPVSSEMRASAGIGTTSLAGENQLTDHSCRPVHADHPVLLQRGCRWVHIAMASFQELVVATLSGAIPDGAILTTTINDVPVTYQVAPGDTNTSIATNIATLIDFGPASTLQDAHGTPLNQLALVPILAGRRSPNRRCHHRILCTRRHDVVHVHRVDASRRIHRWAGTPRVRRRRQRQLPPWRHPPSTRRRVPDAVRPRSHVVRGLQPHRRRIQLYANDLHFDPTTPL